ncbi:hypothetical protein I3760_01G068300 [Carya illinoinensis]|nr:hypothetical protein I3760_01G068300 [Carya illinoinensis]
MRKTLKGKEIEEGGGGEEALAIWDCGSPLYDSYELVSLAHIIERHLMKLPNISGGSKRFIARSFSLANNRVASIVSNPTRKMCKGGKDHRENPGKKKKITWFSGFLGRFGFQEKRKTHDRYRE